MLFSMSAMRSSALIVTLLILNSASNAAELGSDLGPFDERACTAKLHFKDGRVAGELTLFYGRDQQNGRDLVESTSVTGEQLERVLLRQPVKARGLAEFAAYAYQSAPSTTPLKFDRNGFCYDGRIHVTSDHRRDYNMVMSVHLKNAMSFDHRLREVNEAGTQIKATHGTCVSRAGRIYSCR